MNINEVKELLNQFDQSTLTEFDLKEGSFGLYMNKNKVSHNISSGEVKQAESNAPEVMSQPTEVKETINGAVKTEKTEEIISPIVGVAYLKPAPDKANFKQVGDSVKKGDIVCIVEAMKLMNEITATVDGVITEVLIQNEDIVEFNQPLFRVSKGV